jgi:outer membrane beta-barrel protein
MKRLAICLLVGFAAGEMTSGAFAAAAAPGGTKGNPDTKSDSDATPAAEPDSTPPSTLGDTGELDLSDKGAPEPTAAANKVAATLSWQDITVLPRKRFLKGGRVELAPFTGISVNDIMIRHYVFGADLNYFLSDAIWVGLQGNYYVKQITDRESLVGLQYNQNTTLNRYLYGGALNFGYVPVYGKFAWFDRGILHWEIFASAGFGVTKTESIPVNPADPSFTNMSLTPNFALGGRFFLFDWLTINYAIRDYVILDKFESTNSHANPWTSAQAKAAADSVLVHNVMFYVGAGIYLPTKFQYKTAR